MIRAGPSRSRLPGTDVTRPWVTEAPPVWEVPLDSISQSCDCQSFPPRVLSSNLRLSDIHTQASVHFVPGVLCPPSGRETGEQLLTRGRRGQVFRFRKPCFIPKTTIPEGTWGILIPNESEKGAIRCSLRPAATQHPGGGCSGSLGPGARRHGVGLRLTLQGEARLGVVVTAP